jgi:hypothetical protein
MICASAVPISFREIGLSFGLAWQYREIEVSRYATRPDLLVRLPPECKGPLGETTILVLVFGLFLAD